SFVLTLIATIVITMAGLIAGVIFFGWHPVLTPSYHAFSQSEALWKIAVATLYVAWCMSGVIALAFMISTMTDTTLGAMGGAVGFVLISHIINAITTVGSARPHLRYRRPRAGRRRARHARRHQPRRHRCRLPQLLGPGPQPGLARRRPPRDPGPPGGRRHILDYDRPGRPAVRHPRYRRDRA